jgi:hypothetical protein
MSVRRILTRIKILKYDPAEPDFAVDKSVHSSVGGNAAKDSAADGGVDKFVHSTAPSEQNAKDLQASGSVLVIGVGLLRFPLAHSAVWQAFAAWVQSHARWLV